jgi:hypothetical protein
MRGRRHDSIALPGGRRDDDPDPTGTRVSDDARINPDQEHEVAYWSEKLGVSRDDLRRAIQQVGPMVKNVQQHLNISTKPSERTR